MTPFAADQIERFHPLTCGDRVIGTDDGNRTRIPLSELRSSSATTRLTSGFVARVAALAWECGGNEKEGGLIMEMACAPWLSPSNVGKHVHYVKPSMRQKRMPTEIGLIAEVGRRHVVLDLPSGRTAVHVDSLFARRTLPPYRRVES